MANALIYESSPYLLQHAHNPVDWFPWGEQALKKAKEEQKLLLISIGYSACHWCHVMEKESFEDAEVAQLMNKHFVCIKVDREERPDIDQVYMQAVQLMTSHGGWPLHCIALPVGLPFYGGTYFPKAHWMQVLNKIQHLYIHDKKAVVEYADKLTHGIREAELVQLNKEEANFSINELKPMLDRWCNNFDCEEGGTKQAPKFPLPNNYQFLLRYGYLSQDKMILDYVELSLQKMAFGGIYDQIGGGFARYSTDDVWKVPHFEKMLYDNAQLVSLYAESYQVFRNPLFKEIVYDTLSFVERELTSYEGLFYAALDADSEGVEGKYYVWAKEELQHILGDQFSLIADYYNVNESGYWEHSNYILLRKEDDKAFAKKYSLSLEELQTYIYAAKKQLLDARLLRVKPGLDDKILTSWNGLMIKGYIDAYGVFGEKLFLESAIRAAENSLSKLKREDGGLWHSYKNGHAAINGFLEDYAFIIDAFIALYQHTFNERWLHEANALMQYVFMHFYDETSSMFFFTSNLDPELIARKIEIHDNVIPSSNSGIAKSLYALSFYFDKQEYYSIAIQMLKNSKAGLYRYGSSFSNWGQVLLNELFPFYQIAITGKNALLLSGELNQYYFPNKIVAGSLKDSNVPLLKGKYKRNENLLFECHNNTCGSPLTSVDELLNIANATKNSKL